MKKEVYIAAIGILFFGSGVLWYFYDHYSPAPVQIISKEVQQKEILVDIQGAVNKPGVYKMPMGSRVEDLLNASGGVAEGADTKWVEINLNRAKKVSDGEKIYIPKFNDKSQMTNVKSNLIDINGATQVELEAIAGIGPATATKIITGRPYQELTDLVSRKIISAKLYTQIKDLLSVW
jgi:competence protein ComEA